MQQKGRRQGNVVIEANDMRNIVGHGPLGNGLGKTFSQTVSIIDLAVKVVDLVVETQLLLIAELVVDLERRNRRCGPSGKWIDSVINQAGTIRRRYQRLDFKRHGIEAT